VLVRRKIVITQARLERLPRSVVIEGSAGPTMLASSELSARTSNRPARTNLNRTPGLAARLSIGFTFSILLT
jgi:hypothetical protein